jgi:hypothetical protein
MVSASSQEYIGHSVAFHLSVLKRLVESSELNENLIEMQMRFISLSIMIMERFLGLKVTNILTPKGPAMVFCQFQRFSQVCSEFFLKKNFCKFLC